MEQSVLSMIWVYWIVVFPLALEALAAPIILKQLGARVFFPTVVLLWLAPVAVTHFYGGAPKPFEFYSSIAGITAAPWMAHTICYGVPIWGSAASIWIARKIGWALVPQIFSAAVVGGALLFLVANNLVMLLLRQLFGG